MTVDNKIHNGRELEKEENLQKPKTGQQKKIETRTVALVNRTINRCHDILAII